MKNLEPRQWTQLAQSVREGKCIFFLGPGATINYGDAKRTEHFLKDLADKNPGEILDFHAGDGFLVFKDARTRALYELEIRDFYKAPRPNPMLQVLATIPFHTAISVTPDLALRDAFDAQHFACFDQCYTTKKKEALQDTPTAARPLLYNLLGSVKDPQTIITSHADLFACLQSIFGDKNIPDELTTMFNSERTRSIVFLGFEFDKWYFQLILHILGLRLDATWRYAIAQTPPSNPNKTLFEAQFAIEFVENDLLSFVERLAQEFAPTELRKPKDQTPGAVKYDLGQIMKFIAKAFTAAEFEVFCMINFPEVYQEFTPGTGQTKRVSDLVKYCELHGEFERLLREARDVNSYQYDQFGPYHD